MLHSNTKNNESPHPPLVGGGEGERYFQVKCPFCAHIEDKVIDSRLSQDGDVTRRRRECLKCGKRFTTYERVEEALPLVIKKDGRRELFDRTKILNGILRACEKRPVGIEAIEKVVDKIEKGFLETGEREVQSSAIGAAVMEELKNLDEVAYVRFASVYREFRDINEFMKELKGLLEVSPVRKDRVLKPTLPERNIISSQSSKTLRSGHSNGVSKKKK